MTHGERTPDRSTRDSGRHAAARAAESERRLREAALDHALQGAYREDDFHAWARVTMGRALRQVTEQSGTSTAPQRDDRPARPRGGTSFPHRRRAWRVIAIAVVGVFLITAVIMIQPSEPLPAALAGRWTTAEPAYAGRALEIKRDSLIFHVAGEMGVQRDAHAIRRVGSADGDLGTLYTIAYTGPDGAELTLALYYAAAPPTIRLRNQRDMAWQREDT